MSSKTDETIVEEYLTLDAFITIANPNPGLVASFKAEVKNDSVAPRTLTQWQKDFDTQSNRVYK